MTLSVLASRFLLPLVLVLGVAVTLLDSAQAAEPPKVVASIKPLGALVTGVMAGVARPTLLVSGSASPHDYALKPSDAEAIETARLVFWMGPSLEGFLARTLEAQGRPSVRFDQRLGALLLPLRLAPALDPASDRHAETGHSHDRAESAGASLPDLHAWLDPTIAAAMVEIIAQELAVADPERAARYEANAAALKTQLAALDAELAASLASIQDRPFVVFHDAYQYFERRYGLNRIGVLAIHPEAPPGARHLAALREVIAEHGAVCVFAEPQFEPKLIRALVEGSAAHTATLDPLGAELAEGANSYTALLRNLATSLRACLLG